jgi:hypothetical protein
VILEPTVQVKFGPFAVRNKLALEYWYAGLRAGDRVFYELTLDTLVPQNGWVLTEDVDLLYLNSRHHFIIGVRYSLVQPLYGSEHVRPGEDAGQVDNRHQRLGPLFAYTFFDHGYTRFDKPTLLLIANWYVDHRYRLGQADTALLPGVLVPSAGIPYLVAGFAFQSDLLSPRS